MKVGDSVVINYCPDSDEMSHIAWKRIGLVLGFAGDLVQVFWGEDFPCEEEYPFQLEVV